jgi:hypothetical protein
MAVVTFNLSNNRHKCQPKIVDPANAERLTFCTAETCQFLIEAVKPKAARNHRPLHRLVV